jgi:hypothetical protein
VNVCVAFTQSPFVFHFGRMKIEMGENELNSLECWWARQDLNLGPTDYESAALTAELRAQTFKINNLHAARYSH